MRDERGATAVVTALVIVALMGFAALSVDVGSLWWDRKELQNGADSAALALAQQIADGHTPADVNAEATGYATANKSDANVTVTGVIIGANSVTVDTITTRTHWLAPVLGISSSDVTASATASWGIMGGASTLPLTISKCAFDEVLDDPTALFTAITKTSSDAEPSPSPTPDPDPSECPEGPSPHVVPGGFHWLLPDSGCQVELSHGDEAASSPGNTNPSTCGEDELNATLQADEVLVPLFSSVSGTGAGATYQIVGFAAVKLTSYCLTNKVQYGSHSNPDPALKTNSCTGATRWLEGYFVRYVSIAEAISSGGTDYGAVTVQLTD